MGQRLARQHLVTHGGVVNKDRFDRGGLGEVLGLQPLVGVHVRVMRAGAVVQRVLNELKSWNPDGVKGLVIRSPGITHGDRGNTEVLQRLNPLSEDGSHGGVSLEIDAADSAAAIVQTKISGNFLKLGLELNGPGGVAIVLRDIELVGRGGAWNFAEVLLDVAIRTELALLFAGPEAD